MGDLQALLERVEKAVGPDRELDHAIVVAFNCAPAALEYCGDNYWGGGGKTWNEPEFTASIDADLALAELEFPGGLGWWLELETAGMGAILNGSDGEKFTGGGVGKDLCTAILAAIIQAKQAEDGR